MRLAAAWALGEFKAVALDARPQLVLVLATDNDRDVRSQACDSLIRVGGDKPPVIALLIEMYETEERRGSGGYYGNPLAPWSFAKNLSPISSEISSGRLRRGSHICAICFGGFERRGTGSDSDPEKNVARRVPEVTGCSSRRDLEISADADGILPLLMDALKNSDLEVRKKQLLNLDGWALQHKQLFPSYVSLLDRTLTITFGQKHKSH